MSSNNQPLRKKERMIIGASTKTRADALVFFGATGDLAYKQIFPALAGLVARDRLDTR